MAAKRKRLDDDVPEAAPEPAAPAQPALPIPDVERLSVAAPKRYSVQARNHVSFYLPKEMQEAAKMVALQRGLKANDLYLEGLRRILEESGYTADKIGLPNG